MMYVGIPLETGLHRNSRQTARWEKPGMESSCTRMKVSDFCRKTLLK
jgi:hypothetical protein